jgi:hypothetical protein
VNVCVAITVAMAIWLRDYGIIFVNACVLITVAIVGIFGLISLPILYID